MKNLEKQYEEYREKANAEKKSRLEKIEARFRQRERDRKYAETFPDLASGNKRGRIVSCSKPPIENYWR